MLRLVIGSVSQFLVVSSLFPSLPSRTQARKGRREERSREDMPDGETMDAQPSSRKKSKIMVGHPMSRLAISFTTQQINS